MASEQSSNMSKMNLNDPPPPYPGNPPLYPDLGPATSTTQPQPTVGQGPCRVVIGYVVGPKPTNLTCPSCKAEIVTRIEPKVSTKTHIVAGVLCLLFGLLCVWLPYCVDDCKNADHYCPNCDAYIGSYSR